MYILQICACLLYTSKDVLQDVHEFCENEVKEQCKAYDVSGEWPKEIYDKAIEMQLHSLEVPEEYGGPGLSRVDVAALIEEMAIADAGFEMCIRDRSMPTSSKIRTRKSSKT